MDTHFPEHPELVADSGPFAGPGVASDAGEARRVPLAAAECAPRRRRFRLLGGVALAAVVAVGAGIVLTSPYSPVPPADRARVVASARQFVSSLGLHIPAPLAPAAALAWFTHPNPGQPVRAKVTPLSRAEAVRTVEALRGNAAAAPTVPETGLVVAPPAPAPEAGLAASPTTSAPETGLAASPTTSAPSPAPASMVAAADPPVPPVTGEGAAVGKAGARPALVSSPYVAPAADALSGAAIRVDPALQQAVPAGSFDVAALAPPAAPAAVAPPPPAAPQPAAIPAPAAPPAGAAQGAASPPQAAVPPEVGAAAAADPLAAAAQLQSASLATQQQSKVLDLVAKMATMVADMRVANRDLVERLAKADAQASERIDDLQRRVALAEATRAVNAALLAGIPSAAAAAQPEPAPSTSGPAVRPVRSAPTGAAATPVVGSRRYRVQAASDRLAMLAGVDAAGNDAAQLQASIGDEVPGCGRVRSILQRGTTWMVQTEHCTIQ